VVLAIIRCRIFCLPLVIRRIKIQIYRNVILPVVAYGFEAWYLTFREEHRQRVFENRVLRKLSGRKRDEVAGQWERRTLHNEKLYGLHSSRHLIRLVKSRKMGRAGQLARVEDKRGTYRALVGKIGGKEAN
jgi:hypothetical protein